MIVATGHVRTLDKAQETTLSSFREQLSLALAV